MNKLEKIILNKKREVKRSRKKLPLDKIKAGISKSRKGFAAALRKRKGAGIIAEIKRASPSAGLIRHRLNLEEIIMAYNRHAAAISVVTDEKFFKGNLNMLRETARLSKLPVLRKDFLVDEYQLYESRYYGADAVLLISSILPRNEIERFIGIASSLGMDCVLEVGNLAELRQALDTKAKIIGINNRNLKTFKVDRKKARALSKKIPLKKRKELLVIAESGIESRQDIVGAQGSADAFLIGSALMKAENIEMRLKELLGIPLVKVCGITNKHDALKAAMLGADFIGFNFYEKSPRYVKPEKAAGIGRALPKGIKKVGVFVNENPASVRKTAKLCGLDFLQFHGDEDEKYCNSFENAIKVFRIKEGRNLEGTGKFKSEFLLFDTFDGKGFGGTGKSFGYSLVGKTKKKFFLAGGLTPRNVKKAIKAARPFAVDVCSGVERSPGKKDFAKLREFIGQVNSTGRHL